MPKVAVPLTWTAIAADGELVTDNWLATFHDDQLVAAVNEAIANNPDLRVARGARGAGDALREARRRQALSVGRRARARRLQAVGRQLGHAGRAADGQLGARSLGPRALRPCRGRGRRDGDQADFEFARQSMAAAVAKNWFLATEAALQAELARATISDGEELVRLAETRVARRRRQRRRRLRRARHGRAPIATCCARSSSSREQAIRGLELLIGRYPAAAASREHRSCRRSPRRSRPACRRSSSSAGPTSSPPSAASRPPSTVSAKPRRRGCRRSP